MSFVCVGGEGKGVRGSLWLFMGHAAVWGLSLTGLWEVLGLGGKWWVQHSGLMVSNRIYQAWRMAGAISPFRVSFSRADD